MADPTVSYIFGTLTEKQKQYVYEKAGLVMKDSSCLNGVVNSIKRHPNYTDIQKAVIIWILENVAERKKMGKEIKLWRGEIECRDVFV